MELIYKNTDLQIRDLGLTDFGDALQLQHDFVNLRRQHLIPNTILLTEHNPVITLGVRQSANKLLATARKLEACGVEVIHTRRAGGVTAHNPGQLVIYPILDLKSLTLGITEYVRCLENIGIELVARLDLAVQRRNGFPGLWFEDKKIASIGVRLSRSITYHGLAININNDLSIFEKIIPCGLDDVQMTSVLQEIGKESSMPIVKQKLCEILIEYFSNKASAEYEDYQQISVLA